MSDDPEATVFEQAGRRLRILTPLGPGRVALNEVVGEDAISEPFAFDLTIQTFEDEAAIRSLLGGPVTIRLGGTAEHEGFPVNGVVRRINGYVVNERGLRIWHLELVPRLWLLSCIADCRIFQNRTAKDIIETILAEQNIADYEFRVSASLAPMEYCVQYRETTLAFISRLLERFGLFYWHEHEEGKHTLVISDSSKSAPTATPLGAVVLGETGQSKGIARLTEDYSYRPGKWTMTDYDFTAPQKSLLVSTPTVVHEPASMVNHEIYEFPGHYTEVAAGHDITKMHVEIEEALFHRMQGQSEVAAFAAGHRCEARAPGEGSRIVDLLLVRVRHRGSEATHESGKRQPAHYENDFTAVPMEVPYRHPTATPRPEMHGPQTAIVTGPAGDVVYTDEYGRVKVQFYWDRLGRNDDRSSCWIRVSQSWAGHNFGTMHLPRIGQEVIVDFLEGDPDRPIITGRVYNGDNPVPFPLPANRTQSGIKTHSVPGGGSNELRFEDKAGAEQVYLHAQKDLDVLVLNNETRTVKADQTETIEGAVKQTVDRTVTVQVLQDVSETIGGSTTKTVGGSVSGTVLGSVTETVTGGLTQTVGGGITVTTPATMTVTAVGGYNLITPTSAWKVGPHNLTAFGNSFAAAGQMTQISGNRDAVAGTQVQATGLNLSINGIALTFNGIQFKNTAGVELNTIGVEIKNLKAKIIDSFMIMVV